MNDSKLNLLQFLKSQRVMAIASYAGNLWIANVYFSIDDDFRIYFLGSQHTKNNQQILQNPHVAFSTSWFNEKDHADRKAIQGVGYCVTATKDSDIINGVQLHNQNYPEFKQRITTDWVKDPDNQTSVWMIKPTFIKFWNDRLYGEKQSEGFTFE